MNTKNGINSTKLANVSRMVSSQSPTAFLIWSLETSSCEASLLVWSWRVACNFWVLHLGRTATFPRFEPWSAQRIMMDYGLSHLSLGFTISPSNAVFCPGWWLDFLEYCMYCMCCYISRSWASGVRVACWWGNSLVAWSKSWQSLSKTICSRLLHRGVVPLVALMELSCWLCCGRVWTRQFRVVKIWAHWCTGRSFIRPANRVLIWHRPLWRKKNRTHYVWMQERCFLAAF